MGACRRRWAIAFALLAGAGVGAMALAPAVGDEAARAVRGGAAAAVALQGLWLAVAAALGPRRWLWGWGMGMTLRLLGVGAVGWGFAPTFRWALAPALVTYVTVAFVTTLVIEPIVWRGETTDAVAGGCGSGGAGRADRLPASHSR